MKKFTYYSAIDGSEIDCFERAHEQVNSELNDGQIEPWQARRDHQDIDQEASGNFDG